MKIGEDRLAWRRWSLYIDTADQWIGRYPGEHAVFYVLLIPCIVLRHERPDDYPQVLARRTERRLRRRRRHVVDRWQSIRDGIWTELSRDGAKPSWDDLARAYDARAGDARARGGGYCDQNGRPAPTHNGWVPTLDELRIYREPINIKAPQQPQPQQQRPRSRIHQ